MKSPTAESTSIAAGIVAALGASSCCVVPLLLVSAGLGGAWVAQLRALERFFPAFIAVTIASFGFAFFRLYVKPAQCGPDMACGSPDVRRRQRIVFWTTLIAAHALVLSPYYAPYLFS